MMTDNMQLWGFANPAAAAQVVQPDDTKGPVATALPVMEHFYTLQGEGFHWGKAAYFIRLGGCNVGCVWCDVKESWDASKHPAVSIDFLLEEIRKTPARIVVVTGGEPLLHDLAELTET